MVTPRCTCKGLLLEKNMVDGSRIDDLTSSMGGGGIRDLPVKHIYGPTRRYTACTNNSKMYLH